MKRKLSIGYHSLVSVCTSKSERIIVIITRGLMEDSHIKQNMLT